MTTSRGMPGTLSRRSVLQLGAAAGGLAGGASLAAAGQRLTGTRSASVARGVVFEDLDASGMRHPESPGVGGVMVSNGCDVAVTRADGSWTLPVREGDSIFVVKPSGWRLPVVSGIPRFYRHHSPRGTTARLGFPGLAPTGTLPGSVDFGLRRGPEPTRFEAVMIADMQPGNERELGYVRDDTLAAVAGTGAAFAINHGDVMGDDLSLLPKYRAMIGETGMPWHHCPGNHDMNLDSPTGHQAFETWKREIGPTHYAFQHGGATFILLNNVVYFGQGKGPRGKRGYFGRVGDTQLRFVENVLAHVPREQLVVVSMHIPLLSFEDAAEPADNTLDRRHLLEILSRHPNTVSFSGHSHTTEHHYLGREHGFARNEPHHHHVLTAACGSWWSGPKDSRGIPLSDSRDGTPRGLHLLSVDGNTYTTRFVSTGGDRGRQMRVVVSSFGCPLPQASFGATAAAAAPRHLFIDVFDGGPRTEVSFEIEGFDGGPIAMARTPVSDPYIVEQFNRHAALCKSWVKPAVSSHMWVGSLPCGTGAGTHRLIVRSVDQYGREHVTRRPLEIAA